MTLLRLALIATLIAAAPAVQAGDGKLYHDLGEREGIARFAKDAVDRWVADPRIGYTFDNLNLERFTGRLVDQVCELSGGPCHYAGRNMYQAHKGLHISSMEFDALVEDLQLAMNDSHIPFWTQNRLLALLAPMKRDVVTR